MSWVRFQRPAMAFIQRLAMAVGLTSFLAWIYLNITDDSRRIELQYFHPNLLLKLGLFLFPISLVGITIPRRYTNRFVAFLYSFAIVVLVVAIFLFTVFVLIVTNETDARAAPGRAYREYRFPHRYSTWFRPFGFGAGDRDHHIGLTPRLRYHQVTDKIASALKNSNFCEDFDNQYKNQDAREFYKNRFSPIQSGCCMPPSYCGFEYWKSNFWNTSNSNYLRTRKAFARIFTNDRRLIERMIALRLQHGQKLDMEEPHGCRWWANYPNARCYHCDTCLSAVLDNIRMEWRFMAFLNISALIATILFSIYDRRHGI